jgi:RNA polymerase sigma factor FliA
MRPTEREGLSPERQKLAASATGYAEALAVTLSEDVGEEWLPDLRAAAWLGLCEAARTYDLGSAPGDARPRATFTTFAWSRITGAMIDMLRRERARLRPALALAIEKAAAAEAALRDYGDRLLRGDDAEGEMDGAAATTGVALLCMGGHASNPERELAREEAKNKVRQAISHLSERDRTIVQLHHFENQTFQEIGARSGVHEDTVRERHRHAMKRLGVLLRPVLGA